MLLRFSKNCDPAQTKRMARRAVTVTTGQSSVDLFMRKGNNSVTPFSVGGSERHVRGKMQLLI